jgi:hypothetical protein
MLATAQVEGVPSMLVGAGSAVAASAASAGGAPSQTLDPVTFASFSGIWEGKSVPHNKDNEATVWTDCALTFTPQFKIQGNGAR